MNDYVATNPLNLPVPPNLTESQIATMTVEQCRNRCGDLRMFTDIERRMELAPAEAEYKSLLARIKQLGSSR